MAGAHRLIVSVRNYMEPYIPALKDVKEEYKPESDAALWLCLCLSAAHQAGLGRPLIRHSDTEHPGHRLWIQMGYDSYDPDFREQLSKGPYEIASYWQFLDVKLHDIPNTVAAAVAAMVEENVFMISLHAAGGFEMMQAALHSARETGSRRWGGDRDSPIPILLGVTMLPSLDRYVFQEVVTPNKKVRYPLHDCPG